MITITQAVREEIERSPFLAEILVEGLANTAEVARKLRPFIEKRLYEEVGVPSITMALHRLKSELKPIKTGVSFLNQLQDITVRSKVVEFVIPNTPELPQVLEKLLRKLRDRKDVLLTFSLGLQEAIVIVSQEFEVEFIRLIEKASVLRKLEDLSAITLRLPETSLMVPGVYYPILQALALAGISFVEIVSVNTELTILFENKDVDQAFATLKRITA